MEKKCKKNTLGEFLVYPDNFHISNLDLLCHRYKHLQQIRVYTKILTAFPSPYFLRAGE